MHYNEVIGDGPEKGPSLLGASIAATLSASPDPLYKWREEQEETNRLNKDYKNRLLRIQRALYPIEKAAKKKKCDFLPIRGGPFAGKKGKQVTLKRDIAPTMEVENPASLRIGLFFTEEVKSLQINDTVKEGEFFPKYIFNVGEALKPLIARSLNRAFTSYEELDSYPTPQVSMEEELDLAGVARVEWADVILGMSGIFVMTREGSTEIDIVIDFYSSDMHKVTSITGIGEGTDSYRGFPNLPRNYARSVHLAIRNLGEDLIQKISQNQYLSNR